MYFGETVTELNVNTIAHIFQYLKFSCFALSVIYLTARIA